MKKLLLFNILGLIIVSVCIISCAKEKFDTVNNNTGSILGKWNMVADTTWYYDSGKLTALPDDDAAEEYVQFDSNGTGHDADASFTYTLTGKELTLSYPEYNSDGVHYDAFSVKAEVKSLTSNKLFLYFDLTYKDDDGTMDGSYTNEHYSR